MAIKISKAFLLVLAIATLLQSSTAQTVHVVGDALNWIVPSGGATAYSTWAANQTFHVGDILVFNFATGRHDVAEVNKGAFDACNTASPISRTTTSPANITLSSDGEHYYICTFPGHCGAGQKLAVNVSSGASSPAPQPSSSAPQPSTSSPVPTPRSSLVPSPTATPPSTPTTPPTPTTPSSPSPAGADSPPTPTTPSSPSPAGADSPPPSGNSAKTLGVALSSTFLAIFVAFFY